MQMFCMERNIDNLEFVNSFHLEENKIREEDESLNLESILRRNTDDILNSRRSNANNNQNEETVIVRQLEHQNIPQQPRPEISVASIEIELDS